MNSRTGRSGRRLACACALLVSGAFGAGLAAGAGPDSPDAMLKDLQAELERSRNLEVESLGKPYYIAYRLVDAVAFDVEAVLGTIVGAPEVTHVRWLRPEVRVGSYDLDSSEFFGRSFFSGRLDFGRPVVLDDEGAAFRHDVWLATDDSYKSAVERLAQKRAALKNRVETEAVPDFTKEEVVTALMPGRAGTPDTAKWRELVRRLSSTFRDFPVIQESSVRLRFAAGSKFLVTSEGTRLRQAAGNVTLSIRAATQAGDGAPLKHFATFWGRRLEDLPAEAELTAAARRVAEKLTSLVAAPALESYSGPVLFTGQASAELLAQILVPPLSGHRPPTFEDPQMGAAMPKNDLADRLERPVLPAFLSVVDDPTRESSDGRPLIGTYAFDDEGVRAAPVTLVENGVLKTLLMSRRPRKEIVRSNGHGRSTMLASGGAAIGNLFVTTAEGKSVDAKAELIRLCREEGAKSCLMIRVLDQPGGGSGMFGAFAGPGRSGRGQLAAPLEAYRVYVDDGREELVRGLVPGEISIRTLRDISAAGADAYVYNRAMPGAGLAGAFGGGDDGVSGIPAAIVAPSLVFRELEFSREPGPRQKAPLLASPLAPANPPAR